MPTTTPRIPLAAAGLIGLSVVLNLAYLVCDCPLDLAPDAGPDTRVARVARCAGSGTAG